MDIDGIGISIDIEVVELDIVDMVPIEGDLLFNVKTAIEKRRKKIIKKKKKKISKKVPRSTLLYFFFFFL
jgi:hypothetical protein